MPTASTCPRLAQSRYDKGETEAERTAYLNCPMDRDQYEAFIDALLAADKTEFNEWGETPAISTAACRSR
jgi:folate-dependent tRNA-U54 methylase TrmFO/GidA